MLVFLNICPFFFLLVLCRNRDTLDHPATESRIGTLYSGLRGDKSGVWSYSFVFLLRRTLFVALTFGLLDEPGLKTQLMIYATLLYLIYLGYAEFLDTPGGKALEILNESIFVVIQYNFVLLN